MPEPRYLLEVSHNELFILQAAFLAINATEFDMMLKSAQLIDLGMSTLGREGSITLLKKLNDLHAQMKVDGLCKEEMVPHA